MRQIFILDFLESPIKILLLPINSFVVNPATGWKNTKRYCMKIYKQKLHEFLPVMALAHKTFDTSIGTRPRTFISRP